jgi:hypothetical protein
MSATGASRWIRFLRNYGPIPTNDNMYDESIQRAGQPRRFGASLPLALAPRRNRLHFRIFIVLNDAVNATTTTYLPDTSRRCLIPVLCNHPSKKGIRALVP